MIPGNFYSVLLQFYLILLNLLNCLLNFTHSPHCRQDTFDNFAFEIEEDAISHYTATTEISEETYEVDDPDNTNISNNNKKRNKIRTNPHIKGGTLEKKAKNRNRVKRKKSKELLDDQTSTKSSENDTMSDYYTEPENDPNDETVS